MGWSLGFDTKWGRDIGYAVPAYCDHPGCNVEIDRGLYYVCGGEPYGGEYGCGLYFCPGHLLITDVSRKTRYAILKQLCERCADAGALHRSPFPPKPDHSAWIKHKLADESWAQWRKENPEEVAKLKRLVSSNQS